MIRNELKHLTLILKTLLKRLLEKFSTNICLEIHLFRDFIYLYGKIFSSIT